MLEERIPTEITEKIQEVLPILNKAHSFALYATTLLDEKGRNNEYYDAISDCYGKMHQIKKLLKS